MNKLIRYKKWMLQISSNSLVKQYLRDLSRSGLYPNSITATAHTIIQEAIRRQIKAGKLKEYDSYSEDSDETEEEGED